MNNLEVSAYMSIRKGKLAGFQQQVAEIIRLTKEKDTRTLRYDCFINNDQTECEIREAYASSEGWMEHREHVGEALGKLFREFADGHAVAVYGEPSPQLRELGERMMPGKIKWYSFFRGLDS